MRQKPVNFLHNICDETEYLLSVLAQMSRGKFLQDGTAQRACVRSLEIVGKQRRIYRRLFDQRILKLNGVR